MVSFYPIDKVLPLYRKYLVTEPQGVLRHFRKHPAVLLQKDAIESIKLKKISEALAFLDMPLLGE
jgi:hypothetical protein